MILLDTHVIIAAQSAPERLSRHAASAIRRAEHTDGLAVAAFSVWEAAWLHTRGRFRHTSNLATFLRDLLANVSVLPITPEIAAQAAQLGPGYPSDPGDRLIAATAIVHHMPLVTADERIRASGALRTIW